MNEFMKPEYENLKVSLLEIALHGAIGPIRYRSPLNDVGDILGPPAYWGFPRYHDFDPYMGFGGVEVGFQLDRNVVRVDWMKFDLRSHSKMVIPFCRGGRLGAKISILALPFGERKLQRMRERLRKAGIQWSEKLDEPVMAETFAIMSFPSGTRFHFSRLEGNPLEQVTIGDLSWYKFTHFES